MTFFRMAAAALIWLSNSVIVQAQDITLTSHDGKVEVTGNLLSYDGEFYRVATQFGELTVDGSGVTCEGLACPNLIDFVAEVRFSGSSVMAETVLPALIKGFADQEGMTATRTQLDDSTLQFELSKPDRNAPMARFSFRTGTTDDGFADLIADETDVVLALRAVRDAENEAARAAGLGDLTQTRRSRIVALDAMVPVVADENPFRQISLVDLARILSGEVQNWLDLGGPDAPIALHVPGAGTGLRQVIEDQLLSPAKLQLTEATIPHDQNADLIRAVARDPFAIGITSQAGTGETRALPLAGGCGHALAATRQSIKTEDYPLTSPMFLYLPARRLPRIARQFLAFSQSPAAQDVIRQAGYVDQAPEMLGVSAQGDRLANAIAAGGAEVGLEELQRMIAVMRPSDRLSLSFRFEPGSSRPDAQSRANILQLAQALEAGTFEGRQLTFVGFSDGSGAASANARIAQLRARTVRNAVLAAVETEIPETVELLVDGFGEAMPMACDDSEWGRKVNRRVEIWVQ
ncbi:MULTISPECIES: phosphate ABC transporter substrate-binding/OmpA family protein [unclassified Ruegeria]|uniref:phosphate ABC transporter substrate-binding/OmpA family protein n=1 Tax=unclassified Ruegeria TaxID=2625375 RepID=UPI0014897C97|nr:MULTISPECIES: phosphate ABC transporter substrate-binding/OmpA family protein [unclassified Ruegeria]